MFRSADAALAVMTNQKLDQINESLFKLTISKTLVGQTQSELMSPAAFGLQQRNLLIELGKTVGGRAGEHSYVEGPVAKPAILSEGKAREVANLTTEEAVVREVTPSLKAIVDSLGARGPFYPVLVNSERYQWLEKKAQPTERKFREKPDLFVTWEPFRLPGQAAGGQGTGDDYIFGALAHRTLQLDGCVPVLMEGKLQGISNKELGELISYHQQLPGLVHGVLFDRKQLALYESLNGLPVRLTWCTWTQSGTEELLREHLRAVCATEEKLPLLVQLLTKLSDDLGLEFVSQGGDKGSFLGAGSSGRVFAVRRTVGENRGQLLALKAVARSPALASLEWQLQLHAEFKNQKQAGLATRDGSRPFAVPVVENSLQLIPNLGGGYLLESVGTPFSVAGGRDVVEAVDALWHLHTLRIIHGDSRIANLIVVNSSAFWVDIQGSGGLVEDPASFTALTRLDMRHLAASIIGVANLDDLPTGVTEAIDVYVPFERLTKDAVLSAIMVTKGY